MSPVEAKQLMMELAERSVRCGIDIIGGEVLQKEDGAVIMIEHVRATQLLTILQRLEVAELDRDMALDALKAVLTVYAPERSIDIVKEQ